MKRFFLGRQTAFKICSYLPLLTCSVVLCVIFAGCVGDANRCKEAAKREAYCVEMAFQAVGPIGLFRTPSLNCGV